MIWAWIGIFALFVATFCLGFVVGGFDARRDKALFDKFALEAIDKVIVDLRYANEISGIDLLLDSHADKLEEATRRSRRQGRKS